ncbi:glutamine amidotransferase [Teredinibacter turnerae]|uniref:glutamine amidotransferase n=1 Tax=Teredinibacter turnerae TaxID=2426 RepID=UPI0005F7AF8F|nr:glutamine amidotransferase [Teredinibacter turnerae]
MKEAAIIRHLAFEDLGTLADALSRLNYTVSYYEAGLCEFNKILADDPDLLIILGGPIGAYEDADYPFLKTELSILQSRLHRDRPTLGICLGAQLMARALGAKVYPGGEKEIGWFPLSLTEAGKRSLLAPFEIQNVPVLHWHGDTFDIPDGAVHLAASERYPNQAFRWRNNCLALQFHPEVTELNMERWYIGHATEISQTRGTSVSQLRSDSAKYAGKLEHVAGEIWLSWLDQVSTPTGAIDA